MIFRENTLYVSWLKCSQKSALLRNPSADLPLSKDERKALKELQSNTSIVILPADKGRSTVILNREDYLEKCMDHINNGPYQLLKKDPTTKIKTKTLKQLKVLKDSEFIGNKLYYYLKPTDTPAPRFYGQPKLYKPGVLAFEIWSLKLKISIIQ